MKIIFIALFQEWKKFYDKHKNELTMLNRREKEWIYLWKDKIFIYQTGMGPLSNLKLLESLMKQYNISHSINVGMAALIHSRNDIGTIYIPEKIYSIKERNWYLNKEIKKFNFFFETIEKLYTTTNVVKNPDQLIVDNNPFIIDMEAFYLANIMNQYGVPFTAIKVISDFGTEKSIKKIKHVYLNQLQKIISDIIEEIMHDMN